MTFAPANFEVAMCNGLGEDALKVHYLTGSTGLITHKMLPSSLHIM